MTYDKELNLFSNQRKDQGRSKGDFITAQVSQREQEGNKKTLWLGKASLI